MEMGPRPSRNFKNEPLLETAQGKYYIKYRLECR